jgi:hypothetical protein
MQIGLVGLNLTDVTEFKGDSKTGKMVFGLLDGSRLIIELPVNLPEEEVVKAILMINSELELERNTLAINVDITYE